MSESKNPVDALLANLLRQVDRTDERLGDGEHVDDETLALFAAGALTGDARQEVILHLDRCPGCRRVASLLVIDAEPATNQFENRKLDAARPQIVGPKWFSSRYSVMLAMAAVLLVAVGSMLFWPGGSSGLTEEKAYSAALAMLEKSRFDDVQRSIAEAEKAGIDSSRLRNLQAEAVRQIPAPVALAYAGRLSNFGYDIGGVVARDPDALPHQQGLSEAEKILVAADADDLDIVLNRGHALLSLDRPADARAEFERATKLAPKNPLAWLGLGLACFLTEDYERAEQSFRQAIGLDTKSIPARINLAMTLEESGKSAAALDEWRELLTMSITDQDRKKIELAIEQLQSEKAEPNPSRK